MDFLDEFNKKVKEIDNKVWVIETPIKKDRVVSVPPQVTVYNIYKRSLPVGLNKLVAMNIPTLRDANILVKAGKLNTVQLDEEEKFRVTYFDIVPTRVAHGDVYYNDPETRKTKEKTGKSDENVIDWKG